VSANAVCDKTSHHTHQPNMLICNRLDLRAHVDHVVQHESEQHLRVIHTCCSLRRSSNVGVGSRRSYGVREEVL
jgi:hypothetical protein